MKKLILNLSMITAIALFSGCGDTSTDTLSEEENTEVIVENETKDEDTFTEVLLNPQDEQYYKYLWHIDSENSSSNNISQEVSDALNNEYVIGKVDRDADIDILNAWKITQGEGTIVAVIDDGADIDHEDLKDNIYLVYNADEDNSDVINHSTDITHASHGNTCAGFIVSPINKIGTIGTAPKAKVIVIKQEDNDESHILRAFEYAKDHGAKVISCSWGTYDISEALQDELQSLYEVGITVVFASGNDGYNLDKPRFNDESESQWVIGVGASGENNKQTTYSNYGSNIDILAPGGDALYSIGILGIDDMGTQGNTNNYNLVSNNYNFTNGTSFSAPVTAGVVALMYSVNPDITPSQVRDILVNTAVNIGSSIKKIDAAKAVEEAKKLNN